MSKLKDALSLFKFITENNCEFHWHDDDVILFVNFMDIQGFSDLLGDGIMAEKGLDCTMKFGYFCFWMKDICEYLGIELEDIFKK
jgi:hypothetical protein